MIRRRELTTKQGQRKAAVKMKRKRRAAMMGEKAVKRKRDTCKEKIESRTSKPWEKKGARRRIKKNIVTATMTQAKRKSSRGRKVTTKEMRLGSRSGTG